MSLCFTGTVPAAPASAPMDQTSVAPAAPVPMALPSTAVGPVAPIAPAVTLGASGAETKHGNTGGTAPGVGARPPDAAPAAAAPESKDGLSGGTGLITVPNTRIDPNGLRSDAPAAAGRVPQPQPQSHRPVY